jgi:hypothetical protein
VAAVPTTTTTKYTVQGLEERRGELSSALRVHHVEHAYVQAISLVILTQQLPVKLSWIVCMDRERRTTVIFAVGKHIFYMYGHIFCVYILKCLVFFLQYVLAMCASRSTNYREEKGHASRSTNYREEKGHASRSTNYREEKAQPTTEKRRARARPTVVCMEEGE